jgi:putative spermidine/putrescine transport system ATP-binding protein
VAYDQLSLHKSSLAGHVLTLDQIDHRFGAVQAVCDVSLEIAAGELLVLLGPSGCGKSTLLRIIAGFIRQTGGRVLFDGERVDRLTPNRRGVGIVFQNYALFPHMTVAANVAYGLKARGDGREAIRQRVAAMLQMVQMQAFGDRLPRQLSGGQQQRVALARALAVEPKILLLDEPFGALDKNLRLDMQIEIKRLQRSYGITSILVTHDQEEALSMADRIAVLREGKVEQCATPTEVYDRPSTLFVNRFVGTTNIFSGHLECRPEGMAVALAGGFRLAGTLAAPLAAGTRVSLAIRPEQLRFAQVGGIPATVRVALPLGPTVVYELETPDGNVLKLAESRVDGSVVRELGEIIRVEPISTAACRIYPTSELQLV